VAIAYLNPLKPKVVLVIFKISVRTSKRTPDFTITKIDWLTPFELFQPFIFSLSSIRYISEKIQNILTIVTSLLVSCYILNKLTLKMSWHYIQWS
jgi:hypothetical protein